MNQLDSRRLLVFDTETTGLTLHPDADPRKQPKMIEFGGIVLSLDNGAILEEHSFLVDPGESLDAEIVKITGLTDNDLRGQPSFRAREPELRAIFGSVRSMCAHNLTFDRDILHWELLRNGFDPVAWAWPPLGFCTMNLFTPMWGRPPRLVEIYAEVMSKEYPQTHRALDDVRATVEVIQKEVLWEIM